MNKATPLTIKCPNRLEGANQLSNCRNNCLGGSQPNRCLGFGCLKWLASLAFFSLSFVVFSAWAFPEPSMELFRACIIMNPFRLVFALIRTHFCHSVQAWFSSNTTPLLIRIRHQIEYGFGYILIRSPYTPYCIYSR